LHAWQWWHGGVRLHALVRMLDVGTRSSFGVCSSQVSCSERSELSNPIQSQRCRTESPAAAEALGALTNAAAWCFGAGSSPGAEAGRFLLSSSHRLEHSGHRGGSTGRRDKKRGTDRTPYRTPYTAPWYRHRIGTVRDHGVPPSVSQEHTPGGEGIPSLLRSAFVKF